METIDEPNYNRLEKPEYCPEGYYTLMLKCWLHDPLKRPKFYDIVDVLPLITPIQVKGLSSCETKEPDMLKYDANDLITVLDSTITPFWKGVLNNGKVGFFDPKNTDYALGNTTKQQKSSKKKSIFSKVLSPSHALKFDSVQNDITKHIVEDQELLLTPTSPDLSHAFENTGSKPSMHFKFFESYDAEHMENQGHHKYEDIHINSAKKFLDDTAHQQSLIINEGSSYKRGKYFFQVSLEILVFVSCRRSIHFMTPNLQFFYYEHLEHG